MRTLMVCLLVVVGFMAASRVFGQAVVKNPTSYEFVCPDHAGDDAHELAIVRESDGVTIQTLALGDPTETSGVVTGALNVQPVAFGRYRARVRAIAGGMASDWSDPSAIWERVPGKPGGVVVQ